MPNAHRQRAPQLSASPGASNMSRIIFSPEETSYIAKLQRITAPHIFELKSCSRQGAYRLQNNTARSSSFYDFQYSRIGLLYTSMLSTFPKNLFHFICESMRSSRILTEYDRSFGELRFRSGSSTHCECFQGMREIGTIMMGLVPPVTGLAWSLLQFSKIYSRCCRLLRCSLSASEMLWSVKTRTTDCPDAHLWCSDAAEDPVLDLETMTYPCNNM